MAVIIALLISPVGLAFWLALGLTILFAVRRTSRERHQYLRAIHPKHIEISRFFWVGILIGIVVSAISVLARLQVSLAALLALSGLTVIGLILSAWSFSPWWLGLASLATFIQPDYSDTDGQLAANLALLISLLWLAQAVLARLNRGDQLESPVILVDRRQRKSAKFRLRQFYWVPLLVPVDPAQVAGSPVLTVIIQAFAIVGLPLILGASFTARHDRAKMHWQRSWPWFAGAGGALVVYGVAARLLFLPAVASAIVPACISVILGSGLLWQGHKVYLTVTRTDRGVVLIGVVPDTPAAQMNLQPGDRVLSCNHIAVNSASELYNAIQKEPTYCRLRLQQADGELRLAETAIFSGAPHELGMILFPEETA